MTVFIKTQKEALPGIEFYSKGILPLIRGIKDFACFSTGWELGSVE